MLDGLKRKWKQATDAGKQLVTGAVDKTKQVVTAAEQKVVDTSKSAFETAKHNPVVLAADKAVHDPADFARDATRGTLKLAYDGASALLPKGSVPKLLKGAEVAVDVVTKPIALVAGDTAVGKFADKLGKVDLEGIARTDGLKGDWGKLWGTWLFEGKPKDLGVWSKDKKGGDVVTVTDPTYTGDLAKQQTQKDAEAAFLAKYPNPKPGDVLDPAGKFVFAGPDTAENSDKKYNALEWFLGSYSTKVECTGTDPKTGKPQLQFTVTNESHWESGTRVPESGQEAGLDKALVSDRKRDTGVGLGGDFTQRYVWTQPAA
ncbi:MAG: hypothetical protein K1X89_02880 [Myxococcaceae bacterium]|nr:hypothetical protein [Myxococcaceae bacterium]